MKKQLFRILSLTLIILGVFVIVIQPLSPTGAVIDLSTTSSKLSFTTGLTLIIIGILILRFGDSKLERYLGSKPPKGSLRSKDALRKHNKEIEHYLKKAYVEEYGKLPTLNQLKEYKRTHYEQKDLHKIIERYKRAG